MFHPLKDSAQIRLAFSPYELSSYKLFVSPPPDSFDSRKLFTLSPQFKTPITRSHRSPRNFEHEFDRRAETSRYTPSDRLQFTSERTQRDGFQAGRGIPGAFLGHNVGRLRVLQPTVNPSN